jgi:hypothetical protein
MRVAGRARDVLFGGGVVLVSAISLATRAVRGWIPHDEGLLAQSAERVLHGELPHRDFDAAYTGGLELLHAAAFRLLGVQLASLRWTLLAFAVAFVGALYVLARRAAEPPLAAALSLAAVAWSLPNYFAGLPSWYVLFFWTFGGVFLWAYAGSRRTAWLVAAGACAGLAFLAKTPGILFLGAAFLFVAFDEQALAVQEPAPAPSRVMLATLAVALTVLVGGLVGLVSRQLGGMELLVYVVPTAALAALLVRQELALCGGGARVRALVLRCVALAAGAAIPIALFLVPYAASGSLGDFWRGTFVLPQRRFVSATFPLPPLWTAAAALPLAVPLAWPSAFRRAPPWVLGAVAAAAGAALVAAAGNPEVYRAIWYSVRPLAAVAAVLGALTVARRAPGELAGARGGVLLLSLAGLIGLLQYPYAFAIYFCYTAPLALLGLAWTVRERGQRELRWLYAGALGAFAAFAVVWLNTGFVRAIGARYVPEPPSRLFALPRAGLEVPAVQADLYEQVVREIDAHAAPGEPIYAAPDCPEIYFLSGHPNPTRTFYDAFDGDAGDALARERRILRTLAERGVRVVVLSGAPEFSPRVSASLFTALAERYPSARKLGHFLVMW